MPETLSPLPAPSQQPHLRLRFTFLSRSWLGVKCDFFSFSFLDKQLLSPSRKDADVGHRRHRDRKLKQKVLIPRNEAVRDNCVFPINPWNGAASLWLQLRSKHDSYCLQSALNYSHYLALLMTKIPTVHPLVGRRRAVNNHNIPHCYKGTHCAKRA